MAETIAASFLLILAIFFYIPIFIWSLNWWISRFKGTHLSQRRKRLSRRPFSHTISQQGRDEGRTGVSYDYLGRCAVCDNGLDYCTCGREQTAPGEPSREKFVEHSKPSGDTIIHSPRETCEVCAVPSQPSAGEKSLKDFPLYKRDIDGEIVGFADEPSSPPAPAGGARELTTETPEEKEWMRQQHLAPANRLTVYGTMYQRHGESKVTANVGAWYETACYWRTEAEKFQAEVAQLRQERDAQRKADIELVNSLTIEFNRTVTAEREARERAEDALRTAIFLPYFDKPNTAGVCAVCRHHCESVNEMQHFENCNVVRAMAALKSRQEEGEAQ